MESERSTFDILNSVDVSKKAKKKNGLTYLSWAEAWGELHKRFPEATYKVYESPNGWNYFTDGRTCWVKVGVIVNGLEHAVCLPVMDFKNKSISAEAVTSTDVNKALQRALTKAIALHGLGLYIYSGEDLPENPELDTRQRAKVLQFLNDNEEYTQRLLAKRNYEKVEQFTEYELFAIYKKCLA